MPIEILMPALSPTMTEGNLAKWLKKEGDKVSPGDVIAEIETDKATMEVEAVDDGTLGKILVPAGSANVKVNTPIAVLYEKGEKAGDVKPTAAKPQERHPELVSGSIEKPKVEQKAEIHKESGDRVYASPLAKRLAFQHGIAINHIRGTGPNGRIVKADIDKALETGQGVGPQVLAPTPKTPDVAKAVFRGPNPKELADMLGMSYSEEKATGMRKTIALRLTESKVTVPHFYLTVDCAIDKLLEMRECINSAAGGGEYKISVNDMIIKATALTLKKIPEANAMWNGDSVLFFDEADISVAVATPAGLITPIVKKAQSKSLVSISNEMKELASRAKSGKLKPEEYQGGTFTISNLGMYGIKNFGAIINPPQSCILAVGAGERVPAVVGDEIKIVTKMHLSLSVDHRVVDGAVAAQFLQQLKFLLENPGVMLAI